MSYLKYSPAALPSFDVAGRVAELQMMLDDDTIEESQKDNIKVVIRMYENGELPKRIGERTFVQDGKVCKGFPDFLKGTPWWREVCHVETVLRLVDNPYCR
jgi:hypothetical protein